MPLLQKIQPWAFIMIKIDYEFYWENDIEKLGWRREHLDKNRDKLNRRHHEFVSIAFYLDDERYMIQPDFPHRSND